ncbi:MAG: GNAT family N-acetyltransferase [Eubacterium sp.]|nr:GNAT family N-acetyltransferase [Eubacterium sp.]
MVFKAIAAFGVCAEQYGLVTCVGQEPIGFVTWDPRKKPESVEIGHNGIRRAYQRKGYGHLQLQENICIMK